MAEGSQIAWTDLTGGAGTTMSLYSFFSPLGAQATVRLFDAKCVYDAVNQRYLVSVANIDRTTGVSTINIAVSKDSDPSHGWYFGSINTWTMINGQATSSDRPHLSVDGTNIYVTAPQYNVAVSGYGGTGVYVIPVNQGPNGGFYNGDALTITASQITPANEGIFAVASDGGGTTFLASTYSVGSGRMALSVRTFDEATNTFGATQVIQLGQLDQGGAYTAQQMGTSLLLDAGDKRIWDLEYANGFLYGVSELKPIGSSVPLVHWFKVDVRNPSAPVLVAQGDISGAQIGAGVATFNGSIAVNQAGDVVINFTASGTNMYPSSYYVLSDDLNAGIWQEPVLYRASTGFYNSGDGKAVQRWGDYSSAITDPNDPYSFWISGEYFDNGWWQTAVAHLSIAGPAPEMLTTPEFLGMSQDNGVSSSDGLTNDATPTFTVAAKAGAAVDLYRDTVMAATAVEGAPGVYTVTTPLLPDGSYSFTVQARDASGSLSPVSNTFAVTIDTQISAPTIHFASRASDGTTFGGIADPGTTIQIFEGTKLLASGIADAGGQWVAKSLYLKDVVRTVTAEATDAAGNIARESGMTIIGTTKGDLGLIGGAANDVLLGYGGGDILDGGVGGNDRLTGGAGDDKFVFHGAFGTDVVTDYQDGRDKFDLDSGLSFGDLTIMARDLDGDGSADDALIIAQGQSIEVWNTAVLSLTTTDFLF